MNSPERPLTRSLYGPIGHPYYIYSPRWIERSAGIKAMHLLCHALNETGNVAFLVIVGDSFDGKPRINGTLNTPVITEEIALSHFEKKLTPIVIYSETIVGNPLHAPFVVRFIANFLGLLGGPQRFKAEEFICAYSNTLAAHCKEVLKRDDIFTLFFHAIHPQKFEMNFNKQEYVVAYAAKYRLFVGQPKFPDNLNVIEIIRDGINAHSRSEVIELLKNAQALILYENSAIAMEAILLGTPVILMKSNFLNEGIAMVETGGLGMRWGYSAQNIASARKELVAAKELYFKTNEDFFKTLRIFVSKTQSQAANHAYNNKVNIPDNRFIVSPHRLRLAVEILRTLGFVTLLKVVYAFIVRRILQKLPQKK